MGHKGDNSVMLTLLALSIKLGTPQLADLISIFWVGVSAEPTQSLYIVKVISYVLPPKHLYVRSEPIAWVAKASDDDKNKINRPIERE